MTSPYDDPGALLALETELAELLGCHPSQLPRDERGDFEVMGQVEGCSIRLVQHVGRHFVQVEALCASPLSATPAALAEVNLINAELPGARVFVVDDVFTVCAELPLSALGTGELWRAIRMVTEVVLAPAFFRGSV